MWIKVSDRLPKAGEDIIASDGVNVEFGYVSSADMWIDFFFVPTHWMPKPAPPTAEDSGGADLQTPNSAMDAIAALRDLSNAVDMQANNHGLISMAIHQANGRAKQVLQQHQ